MELEVADDWERFNYHGHADGHTRTHAGKHHQDTIRLNINRIISIIVSPYFFNLQIKFFCTFKCDNVILRPL